MNVSKTGAVASSVLIVDGDIVVRHAISDYLRQCGYAVVEAANTDEARIALQEPTLSLDIVVCDMAVVGEQSASELQAWVGVHRPELEVRLAGTLESAMGTAAELCEKGPHLGRPYEPKAVIDYILRLRSEVGRKAR